MNYKQKEKANDIFELAFNDIDIVLKYITLMNKDFFISKKFNELKCRINDLKEIVDGKGSSKTK